MTSKPPRVHLRLVFASGHYLGPGKAELLLAIDETGTISAACRRMKMSYKRAWQLVEAMNAMFAEPLVNSSRGGADHGGARLTPLGREVLDHYQMLQQRIAETEEVARLTVLAAGD